VEPPRVVDLPSYRVLKLRYLGAPPPDPAFLEHWQRFRDLTDRLRVASSVPAIQAIGYAPPVLARSDELVYDACLPIARELSAEELGELELGDLPGGRYVLCVGPITELPLLLQQAKRYAMAHGLAIERGRIEIYRPAPPGEEVTPVEVGYRVHD
jgi:hypothetical protein